MRCLSSAAGALVALLLLAGQDVSPAPRAPQAGAADAPRRLRVPEGSTAREAIRQVREIYGRRFDAAVTSEQKLALAREMIAVASQTNDDPAGRYMLLRIARDIAAQEGAVSMAMQVIERIGSHYDVDVLQDKAAMLAELAHAQPTSKDAEGHQREIADAAAKLLREAAEQERFETAAGLAQVAQAAAKASRQEPIAQKIAALVAEVDRLRTAYAQIPKALALLENRPDDRGANLVVGKYRCFLKGEWSEGLPNLARGNDPDLKALALKELRKPGSAEDQIVLGHGWWNKAQMAPETEKPALLSRARHWYAQAVDGLAGLSKLKIQQRIAGIDKTVSGEPAEEPKYPGFTSRDPARRAAVLEAFGGNKLTEDAVLAGLEWLAKQQRRDGSWSLLGPYSGGAATQQHNPEAATGLALLAFQGAGNTPAAGNFQKNVTAGWTWLLKQQDGTGNFFHEGSHPHPFYTQGICTTALGEVYGMTGQAEYREPAQRAVKYCVESQAPEGGWRYQAGMDGDVSVTGWITTALHTARVAGLKVPEANWRRVERFLDASSPDGGARYYYQKGKEVSLTMTAEGLLCRLYLGWARDDKRVAAGAAWITQDGNLVEFGRKRNTYYWYYATRLCRSVEGEPWKRWNRVMREELMRHQVPASRREAGSWDPDLNDPYEAHGGRLYTTCLCIYMLEEYYRHLPLPKKAGR